MTTPTIVKLPGFGDAMQEGLAPFLEMLVTQQKMKMAEEELKLRKGDLKLRQDEAAFEQQQAAQQAQTQGDLGVLLQTLAQATAAPPVAEVPMATPVMGIGAHGMPFMTPTMVPMERPEVDVGTTLQQANPRAVALGAPQVMAAAERAREAQATRQAEREWTSGLAQVRDPKARKALETWRAAKAVGADMTEAMFFKVFKDVFPEGISYQAVNGTFDTMEQTGLPIEAIAPLYGIPDDAIDHLRGFRVPQALTGTSATMNEFKQKLQGHYASMKANRQILDGMTLDEIRTELGREPTQEEFQQMSSGLVEQEGGIRLSGEMMKALMTSEASIGGWDGIFTRIFRAGFNKWGIPEKQQRIVQAQFGWANAFRYLVSGQQTSDKEFGVIMAQTTEAYGDHPEVRKQKRRFRALMEQTYRDVLEGKITRVDGVRRLATTATTLGLDNYQNPDAPVDVKLSDYLTSLIPSAADEDRKEQMGIPSNVPYVPPVSFEGMSEAERMAAVADMWKSMFTPRPMRERRRP